MAVTFETIPAVPASPLPNSSSAVTAFVNNYTKIGMQLGTRWRRVLSVLGLIHELNIVRSIDYRTKHPQLLQDAMKFSGALPLLDMPTAMAALDLSNGRLADAAQAMELGALQSEGRDLAELPEETLDRIIVLLEAQLAE